jgi:hypothetical protein
MTIKMAFENLTDESHESAESLNAALVDAQNGATVVLSLSYHKVTKTPARLAEVDYRPLAGVTHDRLIGTVKKVAVGKNGPYILLDATLTRAPVDGSGEVVTTKLGWTSVKPEGIDTAQIVANSAAKKKVAVLA